MKRTIVGLQQCSSPDSCPSPFLSPHPPSLPYPLSKSSSYNRDYNLDPHTQGLLVVDVCKVGREGKRANPGTEEPVCPPVLLRSRIIPPPACKKSGQDVCVREQELGGLLSSHSTAFFILLSTFSRGPFYFVGQLFPLLLPSFLAQGRLGGRNSPVQLLPFDGASIGGEEKKQPLLSLSSKEISNQR